MQLQSEIVDAVAECLDCQFETEVILAFTEQEMTYEKQVGFLTAVVKRAAVEGPIAELSIPELAEYVSHCTAMKIGIPLFEGEVV